MDENTIATCAINSALEFTRRLDLDCWNLFTRYYWQTLCGNGGFVTSAATI